MVLSRWFAGNSSTRPQTLLFAWCNPHFPSNLAVAFVPRPWHSQPPNLERKFLVTRPHSSSQIGSVSPGAWKVAPFNSRTATGVGQTEILIIDFDYNSKPIIVITCHNLSYSAII